VGVAGSPVIGRRRGAFSTLLRRPGLRASSDGVLATKSERKLLARTWLYSLYAWFYASAQQRTQLFHRTLPQTVDFYTRRQSTISIVYVLHLITGTLRSASLPWLPVLANISFQRSGVTCGGQDDGEDGPT